MQQGTGLRGLEPRGAIVLALRALPSRSGELKFLCHEQMPSADRWPGPLSRFVIVPHPTKDMRFDH